MVGALQIGSGASLGREGPTVQICAGAASLLARATSLPPRQMRRLHAGRRRRRHRGCVQCTDRSGHLHDREIVGKLDQAVLSGVVIAAALAAVIERIPGSTR
ncbi:MAG: chloride channel protein [Proteobacteria bacterium]|nr:chloride channel protein [Pseudomonadota bacterium]